MALSSETDLVIDRSALTLLAMAVALAQSFAATVSGGTAVEPPVEPVHAVLVSGLSVPASATVFKVNERADDGPRVPGWLRKHVTTWPAAEQVHGPVTET